MNGLAGLTDADIPDSITASNYLPLSGGTLTGNLTLSGVLTAGSLAVSGVSSGGAITAPYFSATSTSQVSSFPLVQMTSATTSAMFAKLFTAATASFGQTATSTFDAAGVLTLASPLSSASGGTGSTTLSGLLKGNGPGQVATAIAGVDYTTPSQLFAYLFPSNATSTALAFNGGLTASNSTTTNSYSTNLAAASARFGGTATSTFTTAGWLGIGTGTPQYELDIQGTGPVLSLTGKSSATAVFLTSYRNSSITHAAIEGMAARGTKDTPVSITSGDPLLSLRGNGWDGTDFFTSGFDASAAIDLSAAENFTSPINHAGKILFSTLASGQQYKSLRMVIDSTGSVGIGTTTPGSLLSLNNIANFSAATSTFYSSGGLNLSAGCFAVASNCLSFSTLAGLLNLSTKVTGTLGVVNGGTGSSTISGLLKGNGTGQVATAVAGVDYATPSQLFAYLFPNNATTTLLNFNGGLLAYASSTIGGGTQASGLTINGGATTTGNAYFAGNVGVGSTTPSGRLSVSGTFTAGTPLVYIKATADGGTAAPLIRLESSSGGNMFSLFENSNNNAGILTGVEQINLSGTVGGAASAINIASQNLTLGYDSSNSRSFVSSYSVPLVFQTNANTERMRIDNAGLVGIGTTTPWAQLSVNTIAGSPAFAIGSSTTQFIVDKSGNVGIGTASPVGILDISSGASNNVMYLNNTNGTSRRNQIVFRGVTSQFSLINDFDQIGNKDFRLQDSVAGAARLFVNTLGDVSLSGSDASTSPTLIARASGNVGIGSTTPWGKLSVTGGGTGTGIGFAFADSANSPKFVIQDNGNVGIGTTTPGSKLTISSTNAQSLYLSGTAAGTRPYITLSNDISGAASSWNLGMGIGSNINGFASIDRDANRTIFDLQDGVTDSITVANTNSLGTFGISTTTPWGQLSVKGRSTGTGIAFVVADQNNAPKFVIQDNGNVGIGTTSPLYKLDVRGGLTGFNVDTPLHVTSDARYVGLFVDATLSDGTGQSNVFFGKNGAKSFQLGSDLSQNGTKDFFLWDSINTQTRWYVGSTGNVGIGTTTPGAKLTVQRDSTPSGTVVHGNTSLFLDAGGSHYIQMGAPTNSTVGLLFGDSGNNQIGAITYNNATDALTFQANPGLVVTQNSSGFGLGSTSPWRTLSVTGTVGFDGLTGSTGAGSLCLDANKQVVYNSASDACLSSTRATKHDITPLSLDNSQIVTQLQPVSFVYNQGDGRTRYGFIAEDAGAVDPHFATYNASGSISGIDDRAIIATVVKAIKEIAAAIAGFSDHFFSRELTFVRAEGDYVGAREISAHERLCVGATCVTESQLIALLAAANASTASALPSQPSASLIVNGNNPTDWLLNAAWQDNLGALFTHDGQSETIYSTSTVDTAQAGTTTINYWAVIPSTQQWLHTTRDVVISAPANDKATSSPPAAANDNPPPLAPTRTTTAQ